MNIFSNLIKSFIFVILTSFYCTTSIGISSNWDKSETSKLRLISPYSENNKKDLLLGLEYQMEPGWKTYWKSPGEGGFPQTINIKNSTNIKKINILWPTPFEFEILGLKSLGYQDKIIFPLEVQIEDEAKDTFIDLKVNFLICKEICIPGDARVFLDIPAGERKITDKYFHLERAMSNLPQEDLNSSYIKEIDAKVLMNKKSTIISIKAISTKSFFNPQFFLHTPFGLPIVKSSSTYSYGNKIVNVDFEYDNKLIGEEDFPLEIIIQDKNHNFLKVLNIKPENNLQSQIFNNTLIYYILISLLGGLILNVMPCVFPILSIKLMSVFSSEKYNARISFLTTALGIIISFVLLGVTFILLQYFQITISWGMQFQQPYFLVFITLIIFLFMMNMFNQFEINLPSKLNNINFLNNSKNAHLKDFFNGFFATLLATPCSAPFVGTAITAAFTQTYLVSISIFLFMGIGMSLPYLLVAIFPKIINFLPKPGSWMVYVKYFLGMLLFLTVIWLSNILLSFLNYSFLFLSLLLLLILTYREKIIFFKNLITVLVLIGLLFLPSVKIFQQNPIIKYDDVWLNYFEVNMKKLLEDDHKIFLDITADWCATCQFNKVNVLNSNTVLTIFKDNKITLIRADWTRPNEQINIFLEQYDRFGIPFNAFFSNNFPNGILLSELLSEKEIVNAIKKINNE